jgi:PAS domain S-box-containing protein
MLAAIIAGFWAGLLATVTAALLTVYWFLPPTGSFRIESITDVVGVVLFSGMAVFMSVVAELFRHSRQKVAGYEKELALRESKEALRKSEERYRILFEESRDAIYATSREGEILDANRSMFNLFGYSREEMIGLKARETYVLFEDRLKFQQKIEREGFVRDYEIKLRKKDGTEMDCLLTATVRRTADGDILGYQGIIRDITERKRAEEEYRTILRTTLDGFWIADTQGRFLDVNDAYCHLIGYGRDELLTMRISDVEALERPEETAQRIKRIMETGGTRFETCHRCKDGKIIDVEVSVNYVKIGNERLYVFLRDITERKKAAEALRESEERYRSLFENMLDGYAYCKMLFEHDRPRDFIYLDVNRSFETLTGLKNVVGRKVSQVIPGVQESNPDLFEIYGRVALTGKPERFETYLPSLGIWFSISVFSPAREYFVAAFDNITRRKQIEEERKKLIHELQEALANIKTLRGLLPICSHCKKIRDDKGYWNQIESYIRDHSSAEFTHGMCPECMKKLYPDFVD